jgi:hypothetical protein
VRFNAVQVHRDYLAIPLPLGCASTAAKDLGGANSTGAVGGVNPAGAVLERPNANRPLIVTILDSLESAVVTNCRWDAGLHHPALVDSSSRDV